MHTATPPMKCEGESGVEPLAVRRRYFGPSQLYKIINALVPKYLIGLLPPSRGQINQYQFRRGKQFIPSRSHKIYVRNSFFNSVRADWNTLSPEIRLSDTIKNFKTRLGNPLFKYRPNELYLLGNGDSVMHHGRIRMGLSALNGQRKRYGFINDNKYVFLCR